LQEWLDAQDRRWDPCKALGLLGVAHFWSHGVQRAAVHFATHVSFAKAQDFMQEHHRVRIDEDTLRRCTYVWGQTPMEITQAPVAPSATPCVTEMDGSMVGRVRTKAHSLDARHTRSVFYQEVKVAVVDQGAYRQYDATLQNADVAGAMWHRLVSPCLRPETYVHGVGDGAPWIRSQFHGFLGRRGKYLLDFYHAGDYLQKVAEEHGSKPAWVARQKEHLLAGRTGHLFRNLRRSTHSHREQGAAQTALGYLQKCQKHLHYLATQARDLPIGSGLIESTHRSVIQSRMKQPGMWWGDLGVHCMLRLRLVHHNDRWETLCNLRLP
jgi:hypothetical protein